MRFQTDLERRHNARMRRCVMFKSEPVFYRIRAIWYIARENGADPCIIKIFMHMLEE